MSFHFRLIIPLQTGRVEVHFPSWHVIEWLPSRLYWAGHTNVTLLPCPKLEPILWPCLGTPGSEQEAINMNTNMKVYVVSVEVTLITRFLCIRGKFSQYRKVPIVATPESNVKSFWLLLNPENSEPSKVATLPPKSSESPLSRLRFFNYKHTESYPFNVFQLQSIVKFLMYIHFKYLRAFTNLSRKALYNKENVACLKLPFVVEVS